MATPPAPRRIIHIAPTIHTIAYLRCSAIPSAFARTINLACAVGNTRADSIFWPRNDPTRRWSNLAQLLLSENTGGLPVTFTAPGQAPQPAFTGPPAGGSPA